MSTPAIAPVPQKQDIRAFPVSIDSLDPAILKMDLYLKTGGPNSYVLYRSVGVPFTADDQRRLLNQGLDFLYVPFSQHAAYRAALLDRLEQKFEDPAQLRAARVHAIRSACVKMIEDVLLFPSQPETIDAVADISRRFAVWASRNYREFSYLLDMSAHDYYTVTHMVNVGVGCGLLAKELSPGDSAMQALMVQGGMLHDIGKRHVPEEILNKPGRLTPQEWELVKRHPELAYEELRAHPDISPVVLEMARDHHERPDGTGYARGLAGPDVGLPARVCAVVDVYDAISSARSYRPATPPNEVLRTMHSGAGVHFDPYILSVWARLVSRLLEEDPSRAPSGRTGRPEPNACTVPESGVRHVVQAGRLRPAFDADAVSADERRRHPRYSCRLIVQAVFLRQGKPGRVNVGETVDVEVLDISRSGLQLKTRWPLTLNDLLEIELPAQNGAVTCRRTQVVRVRQAKDGGWIAGLCFVSRVTPMQDLGTV